MGFYDWIKRKLTPRAAAPGSTVAAPQQAAASPEAQAASERLYLEGARHLAAGRLDEAERALSDALSRRHDHAGALMLQGVVYHKQGRLEDAMDSLALATHFAPELAQAHFHLGVLAERQGRRAEAIGAYERALAANPGYAEAYNARGAARMEAGDPEAGIRDFERAIELKPDFAPAHSNLGCVLITRLDRFEEGAAHIEAAWRLAPQDHDVQVNWAMLLQHRGQLSESLDLWNRLIEGGHNVNDARLNRAMVRLKQGDFAGGWEDYESRKHVAKEHGARQFPFPEWTGGPLAGHTLLVYAEQGLGDQIMFASCLPDLVSLAGHCVIECAPKLKPILARSFPGTTVVSRQESAAGGSSPNGSTAPDRFVALGSLPRYFRNALRQFPEHRGYLKADPARVAAWKRRLAELPGTIKVGISWRGGTQSTRRSVRSLPLERWGPVLSAPGVDFVSLQYTDCQDELVRTERETGVRVHHWQEAIDDYDETAALLCALDLVVSVQTAVVHLAGALGRPAWVMLPAVSEWRYLELEGRMPWYPSMRLFRQAALGDWSPLIERVANELSRFRPA